eukprot:1410084-Amphidinium_carterae.1
MREAVRKRLKLNPAKLVFKLAEADAPLEEEAFVRPIQHESLMSHWRCTIDATQPTRWVMSEASRVVAVRTSPMAHEVNDLDDDADGQGEAQHAIPLANVEPPVMSNEMEDI